MPAKKQAPKNIIKVPRTNVLMVLRLFLVQGVALLSLLAMGGAVIFLSNAFGTSTILILIVLVVLIVGLDILFSWAIFMEWKNKEYEIRPEGIVYKRGVFFRREVTYPCNNIESIILRQGILGQYFGYGTLRLYDPALQQTIEMTNILNPDHYKQILTKRYITDDTDTGSRVILG